MSDVTKTHLQDMEFILTEMVSQPAKDWFRQTTLGSFLFKACALHLHPWEDLKAK